MKKLSLPSTTLLLLVLSSASVVACSEETKDTSLKSLQETVSKPLPIDLSGYLRHQGTALKAPPSTSDSDLQQLLQPQFADLRELLLVNTKVSGSGLNGLNKLKLDKLYLTGSPVTDEGLKAIGALSTITQLSLNDSKISDAGLAHLSELKLQHIYLNNTAITDNAAQYLSVFPLKTLYAANTKLGDQGMAKLATLPITSMNISGTMVSDDSISILRNFPLYKAYLRNSKLSAAQVDTLRRANVAIDF